jgi:LPXTG-site transpeptidase (sortase) family protein
VKKKFLPKLKFPRWKSFRSPIKTFKAANTPRKLLFGLGAVSFVGGVTLLGFAFVSAISGGDGRTEGPPVVQVLTSPTPTIAPRTDTATPAPTPVPSPPLGDSPYQMIISKLGVSAPVETFGLDDKQAPEVPTGDDAADVVAWYNFSARPGTGSNAVFAGHVTWFGPAVFYNLTSIAAGDEITLLGQDGTKLVYKVSDIFSVDPTTDPHAVDVMFATPSDVLTIITCDGTFTKDPNDHVFGGDYNHRLVVRAALSSVTPGSANAAAAAG